MESDDGQRLQNQAMCCKSVKCARAAVCAVCASAAPFASELLKRLIIAFTGHKHMWSIEFHASALKQEVSELEIHLQQGSCVGYCL